VLFQLDFTTCSTTLVEVYDKTFRLPVFFGLLALSRETSTTLNEH
jgi:hypothetical protein